MTTRQAALNRGRSGRTLLGLEPLEDRTCLSTLSVSGHVLTISGDASANSQISVKDDGHGDVTASVTAKGVTKSISAKSIQGIVVSTGNGNDSVSYSLTGAMTTSRSITVNLGAGDDQVGMNFSQGVSAPGLNVTVHDGSGIDRVVTAFGAVKNTVLNLTETGGSDIDTFYARFSGDITGTARVAVNAHNGSGYNGIDIGFQGYIGPTAQVAVNTTGGASTGTTHVNYLGELDGKLTISEHGGSGGDFLASNVTLKTGSTGTLQDNLVGGVGNDLLVLNLKDNSGKMKSVQTSINGDGGVDIAFISGKVSVKNAEIV
jgi:hypothetical protein